MGKPTETSFWCILSLLYASCGYPSANHHCQLTLWCHVIILFAKCQLFVVESYDSLKVRTVQLWNSVRESSKGRIVVTFKTTYKEAAMGKHNVIFLL